MKRIKLLAAMLAVTFLMVACGQNTPPETSAPSNSQTEIGNSESEESTTTAETTTAETTTVETTVPTTEPVETTTQETEPEIDTSGLGFDVPVPTQETTSSAMLPVFEYANFLDSLALERINQSVSIDLIELSGDKPRSNYSISNNLYDDFAYQMFEVKHHHRSDAEGLIEESIWLPAFEPTLATVSDVFQLNKQTLVEYTTQARSTFDAGNNTYSSILYVPENATSFEDLIPFYFDMSGTIGSHTEDFVAEYSGEKTELMINLPMTDGTFEYQTYLNLGGLTLENALKYHPYLFAVEARMSESMSNNLSFDANVIRSTLSQDQMDVYLLMTYSGDQSDVSTDKAVVEQQVSNFVSNLPGEGLPPDLAELISSKMIERLDDLGNTATEIIADETTYLIGIQNTPFNYGLRLTVRYSVNENGEKLPLETETGN